MIIRSLILFIVLIANPVFAGNAIDVDFKDTKIIEITAQKGDALAFLNYDRGALVIEDIKDNNVIATLYLTDKRVWGKINFPLAKETLIDVDRDNVFEIAILIDNIKDEDIQFKIRQLEEEPTKNTIMEDKKENLEEISGEAVKEVADIQESRITGLTIGLVIIIVGLLLYFYFVKY